MEPTKQRQKKMGGDRERSVAANVFEVRTMYNK